MSPVSYQAMLPGEDEGSATTFEPLPVSAVATRRKDARTTITVRVSKAQRAWLREVADISGKGIDEDVVARALIDVGRELPIDWALLAGAKSAREAVRTSAGRRVES